METDFRYDYFVFDAGEGRKIMVLSKNGHAVSVLTAGVVQGFIGILDAVRTQGVPLQVEHEGVLFKEALEFKKVKE